MNSKRIARIAAPFSFLVLASTALAGLPDPGMQVDAKTALVITDPQNDFLSPKGVTWGVVGESVTANNTVPNIETLFKAAKAHGIPVFVSPHYYYPTDDGWEFGGAVETMMHGINMFDRKGALSLKGFNNSGADWLARYKKYIYDGEDRRDEPAQGLRPGEQRLGPAAAQARHRAGHLGRHVGQPLRRVAPSRAPRAGLRGCRRQGCNRCGHRARG